MPIPSIDDVMARAEPYLDLWDGVLRHGHAVYQGYPPEAVIDHDSSTQAHCTYRHMRAEALRAFDGEAQHFEVQGLNLWLFTKPNLIIRLKKMDEQGVTLNYPTDQTRAFDRGDELPGIPEAPIRLRVGYLLDPTGSQYLRSQVSFPVGRQVGWCAAIVPRDEREGVSTPAWTDVTRAPRFL